MRIYKILLKCALQKCSGVTYENNDIKENSSRNIQKLEKIIHSMHEGLVVHGPDGKIIDHNPAALEILGFTEGQLLGREAKDPRWKSVNVDGSICAPEDHPSSITLREGKSVTNYTMAVDDPSRGLRWLLINSVPMAIDNKINAIVTFKDITNEVLKQHEVDTYIAGLKSYAIIANTDVKGKITFVNELFCKVSGYSKEELLGKTHQVVNSGYHDKVFFKKMWKTISSGKVWKDEIKNKAKNGKFYWVDTTISPKLDLSGNVIGYMSFRYDISNRKTYEEELKKTVEKLNQSFSFLNTIQDSAAHAMISTGKDGIITSFNKKAEDMLGYKSKDVVGKETPALFHDLDEVISRSREYSKKLNTSILPGFETFVCHSQRGLENIFEWTYVHKDGTRFPVRLAITSVYNNENEISSYLGIAEDIRELKKKEEELKHQKALTLHSAKLASIGELAAGVGHEINNPLAIIMGYSNSIRKALSEDKRSNYSVIYDKIDKINIAIERISKIVQGLRTFSREELVNENRFCPIKALIETYNLIREIYKHENIHIILKEENQSLEDIFYISGNKGKFQQILMNIISNAKDALSDSDSDREKIISITYKKLDSRISLEISDNGPGIPEHIRDRVFDPFFTTKDVNKGTGIGLTLAHNFLEELSGTIQIDSELNQGTKVSITIPRSMKIPTASTHNETINKEDLIFPYNAILADDEEGIRNSLSEILQELGLNITKAKNGQEAFEFFSQNPKKYDLIISDMKMPVMGGFELLSAIRSQESQNQPKFIVMTGGVSIDFKNKIDPLVKMIDGFIYKPFGYEEILEILRKCFPATK